MSIAQTRTKTDFRKWLEDSHAGDIAIYFEGVLSETIAALTTPKTRREDLESLRRAVYRAYQSGMIFPVQRRIATNRFEYRAIKAKKPYEAPIMHTPVYGHRVQITAHAREQRRVEALIRSAARPETFLSHEDQLLQA